VQKNYSKFSTLFINFFVQELPPLRELHILWEGQQQTPVSLVETAVFSATALLKTACGKGASRCEISDFRREVAENCALLGHYAASSGDFLQTLCDNLTMGTTGCHDRSVRNCQNS
jgi:hypothetical protein